MKMMFEVSSPIEKLIIKRIDEKFLDDRLLIGIRKKMIPGEQWFRKPENWYKITAFANPYKTPYTELRVIFENEEELKSSMKNTRKIFYGIGVAETETFITTWDLKEGYAEIIGIDAISAFIENFIQILRNLTLSYPGSKVLFRGINDIFENVKKEDLLPQNSRFKRSVHVCLGNTVGNFPDQEEIFSIFQRNMERGDLLLLGVQLNISPRKILSEYADNVLFEKLILDSIRFRGKLSWCYNEEESRVEAWFGDILAFQSKKYDLKELLHFLKNFDLFPLKTWKKEEIALCLFKKG